MEFNCIEYEKLIINSNLVNQMGNQDSHARVQDKTYAEKVTKNWELLLMYHKLEQLQESCWGKFFRFEKSEVFSNFEKRCSIYRTVRIRLDDIIYMVLLLALTLTFYFLPIPDQNHYLYVGFRQFLIYLIIFSVLWLVSDHWFRHCFFFSVTLIFPALTFLLYNNVIIMDPIDTSFQGTIALPQSLEFFHSIAALVPVFGSLYLVYPLKEFIRNKIGSLYSYLFALSFLCLFIIWPMYSLIYEYIDISGLTFDFITQNKALIISFIIIVTFSFHLLVHNTFFEGDFSKVKQYLLYDFSKEEVLRAVEEITEEQLEKSIIYKNYQIYTKIMSGIVLAFTLLIEIYTFIYLSDNLEQILQGIGVMAFGVLFLVYGCLLNRINVPRSTVLYISSIISVVPVSFSILYYSLPFYEYVFISCCLPYTTLFWCVIRSLSHRRPFLKTNALVLLYIFIHIPITLFILNNLQMITVDTVAIDAINYIIIGILGLVCLVGLVSFIVWLCMSVKELPASDIKRQKQLDYNYFEPGDPQYIPYKKQQSFSLAWLGSLDIRNMAQLFSCFCFILSELASFYIFNELFLTVDLTTLYSPEIIEIIEAQYIIAFMYFTYCFVYIVFEIESVFRIILLIFYYICGITGVIVSYTIDIDGFSDIDSAFRIGGGIILVVSIIGTFLEIIKRKNPQIDNFIAGFVTILLWIFLVLPYAIIIPIASVYIPVQEFGIFIYSVIMATTLLMILLVSIISVIFNLLLGKFEEEKKIKFITEDVSIYLKEEGLETQDEIMHILYESYEHRDKKFVFFLKRGYPVRLWKQLNDDKTYNFKTIIYNQEDLARKQSLSKISTEDQRDNCWKCLTFCCGVDEDEVKNKMLKAQDQIMDDEQMEDLVPKDLLKDLLQKGKFLNKQTKKKATDPSKIFSSKSIILKHLQPKEKSLGEEYALLQKKMKQRIAKGETERQNLNFANKSLQIQIWHEVFNFIANNDDSPMKIIYNDFKKFFELLRIPQSQLTMARVDQVFFSLAETQWKNITALDINQFTLALEEISEQIYFDNSLILPQDRLSNFLIYIVYPQLSFYPEFRDFLSQRKVNSRNRQTFNHQSPQNNQGFENSPFVSSYKDYRQFSSTNKNKKKKFNNYKAKFTQNKLIEPNNDDYDVMARKNRENENQKKDQVKQKSCKVKIYEKYKKVKNCCKDEEEDEGVIKRKNVKPWEYLAIQVVRILERKQAQWKDDKTNTNYEFRIIPNNLIIAAFKLADLYTYLEITVLNPAIGWQDIMTFSVLILEYRIQFYIALALIFVCIIFGIKGISYILEDRLGLTETRVPAAFPHPMFFFTVVYKLLILALFNTIIMTLLSTFMCNWESLQPPYYMILNEQNLPLECFSIEHNIYLILALIGILVYYPLSSYTMPNFQFSEKALDLKYKPTYLIIYFQVNFTLAAGKVLLSQLNTPLIDVQTFSGQAQPVEVVFQCLNIASLTILLICAKVIEPCLIKWFNYIQMLVISIGLIWNVMGLVLYLTNLWQISLIIACSLTGIILIFTFIFIKKRFFSKAEVMPQAEDYEIQQLQMNWNTRKQYHYNLVKNKKNEESGSSQSQKSQKQTNNRIFDNLDNNNQNSKTIDFDDSQQILTDNNNVIKKNVYNKNSTSLASNKVQSAARLQQKAKNTQRQEVILSSEEDKSSASEEDDK